MKNNSLKIQAYSIIKERIVNCIYPPGIMLNEEKLQNEIKISRTPIRDALSRLEQDGLIIIKSKKGILVSPLNISEMNMIFETRILFEPYGLLNYGYTLNQKTLYEHLKEYTKPLDDMTTNEFFSLDDRFHEMIINNIPNKYIQQCYGIISAQNRRFRILTGSRKAERLEETNQEHILIIKACLKENWNEASEKMKEHLLKSKDSTFELLLENGFIGTEEE